MSSTVKIVADASHSLGNTYNRDEYILVIGWIRALKTEGYNDVKFELQMMKSKNGRELLERAFKHW